MRESERAMSVSHLLTFRHTHAHILFSNRQMKECTRNLLRAKVSLICAGQGKPSNGSLLTHKHSFI